MIFAAPHLLWLLVVVPPALVIFFWWSARKSQTLMTRFIHSRLLPNLTVGLSLPRRRFRQGCLVAAAACLIIALARPQWGFDWEEARLHGLDIVVAIDTSKSMLAEDAKPSRLGRAKLAALELMQRAKSDRLGLVAFAGEAFLQCPLTIDDTAFRQSVEALDVNTIPEGGTAIGAAIEAARGAFKEGDNHRVLVLITDGEDQDTDGLETARKAAAEGMRIYTIGVGTTAGEVLRVKKAGGGSEFLLDEEGHAVKSHLNEDLLRQIAGAAEGFYLPLQGALTMDALYDQGLAKLPKSEHEEKLIKRYHERYQWPLAVAVVLLVVETLLPERRREAASRRSPAPAPLPGLPSPNPL